MSPLDPVDYAVISQALLAASREMGTKLVRSAYSNIVREARDDDVAALGDFGRRGAGGGAELLEFRHRFAAHIVDGNGMTGFEQQCRNWPAEGAEADHAGGQLFQGITPP